jgi:hypothetical protein
MPSSPIPQNGMDAVALACGAAGEAAKNGGCDESLEFCREPRARMNGVHDSKTPKMLCF